MVLGIATTRGQGTDGLAFFWPGTLFITGREGVSKFSESGLFRVKCEIDGVVVAVVGRWIVEEYAGGRRGRMAS